MFLFESLVKIERNPNKLYLITKYTIKSLWSENYNEKKDQLQRERKALLAKDAALREKDMKYRILFSAYCIPVAALTSAGFYLVQGYASEELTKVFQMFSWLAIAILALSLMHIPFYIFDKGRRERRYNDFSKYHGRFDIDLLHVKTILIYQLEIIKAFASYFAFIFIIRLVWCIILFETGLDAFFTPPTRLGLDELYLYVGGILVGLFAIITVNRAMKRRVVASWEKLDGILAKLESQEPLAAQFIS